MHTSLITDALRAQLARAEVHRREPSTLDTYPLTAPGAPEDYGGVLQALEAACAHLSEALPCGQRARAAAAYAVLAPAVRELGAWLAAKGYTA